MALVPVLYLSSSVLILVCMIGCGESGPNPTRSHAPDTLAPAVVEDLSIVSTEDNEVVLEWTAPGNDDNEGVALQYVLGYSDRFITDISWLSATSAMGPLSFHEIPIPDSAGTVQQARIRMVPAGKTYWIALKTWDGSQNSGLSNQPKVELPLQFEPSETLSVELDHGDLYAVQLNKDPYPDLVASRVVRLPEPQDGLFAVFLNLGGDFPHVADAILRENSSARLVGFADLDGDGHPDYLSNSYGSAFRFFRNTGDGLPGEEVVIPLPDTNTGVAAGDLDGDGAVDVVAGLGSFPACNGCAGGNGAVVLYGEGGGAFGSATALPVEALYSPILLDFDGDQDLDIAMGVGLCLIRADVSGGFTNLGCSTIGFTPGKRTSQDLNLDGRSDLIVMEDASYSRHVNALLGSNDGLLTSHPPLEVPRAFNLASGDFDDDGIPDLVLIHEDGFSVWPGRGDGNFDWPAVHTLEGVEEWRPAVADLNQDGSNDLAVMHRNGVIVLKRVPIENSTRPRDSQ